MKKTMSIATMVLLLVSMASVSFAAPKWKTCPINSDTDFVYYSGSGASTLSQSWMDHFFTWWQQQDPSISFQDLSARDIGICNFADYPDLDMYVQPGGDAYLAQKSIGADGKSNINDWIDGGGAYFGACAGWYYAAGDYYWQDNYYDHSNLLGAYPGTVEGSIREIADWDVGDGYAISPLDNGHNALYWGGPTMEYEYTPAIVGTVEASHSYMSLPAVITYNNMLLTSVHLEAYEGDGFTGLSTEDRVENYKLLANKINEVAGTSFYVPPYAQPPAPAACEDGLDNDGDGLIDYPADPDCIGPLDNDESYVEPPVGPILEDDFESGLSQWTLSGSGRDWAQQSDNPYEGNYAARAKRTGAGKNSYMEASFDASGAGTVTLEYHRKLVGLDAADNFWAKYYDGGWVTLEELGSGSENGGYVYKTYTLPDTATKIQFMCEAGATSEKCYVDNVIIN